VSAHYTIEDMYMKFIDLDEIANKKKLEVFSLRGVAQTVIFSFDY